MEKRKTQTRSTKECYKQMVDEYEGLIIPPPEQFRDEYRLIPKPRTDRPTSNTREPKCTKATKTPKITTTRKEHEDPIIPPLQFRDDKPLQEPDSITDKPSPKIKELNRALKGHAKSYEIEIEDNLNPLNNFTKTEVLVESHLKDLLKIMKGYKFIETLEVTFKKETSNSKTGKRENIHIQNSILHW